MFHVQVVPRGPNWGRYLEQLQPRYSSEDDQEPGDTPSFRDSEPQVIDESAPKEPVSSSLPPSDNNSTPEYSRQHPRRSTRRRKPPDYYVSQY
ncbi:Hypothetical predicted protein [Octopus vulgaris]|uniref:Uncharacterized protein n=1 Tax=Octopus vulgaris TaxID=6645 RepID=A0AA36AYG1_OCTVU|nr:Hypothetical predicted protein [Octopus vulgaris]